MRSLLPVLAATLTCLGCSSGKSVPVDIPKIDLKVDLTQFDEIQPRLEAINPRLPSGIEFVQSENKTDPTETKGSPSKAAAAEYEERTKQLLLAAEKGRASLIVDLVKKGADVNDKDEEGRTALHKAIEKKHRSVIFLLILFGADLNEKDSKGITPFMVAAEQGDDELMKTFSSHYSLGGEVRQVVAAKIDGVKVELSRIEDRLSSQCAAVYKQVDGMGRNAIMILVANGHSEPLARLHLDPEAVLRKDKKGQNSIHLAASNGNADALKSLIAFYNFKLADLATPDSSGKSPLEIAEAGKHKGCVETIYRRMGSIAATSGDLETVKLVLEKSPGALNYTEALENSVRGGHASIVKLLMELTKEKKADEKLLLMRATGDMPSLLQLAAHEGRNDLVLLLTSLDWWKEKETLLAYLNWSAGKGYASFNTPVHMNVELRGSRPATVKLVQEILNRLETMKK